MSSFGVIVTALVLICLLALKLKADQVRRRELQRINRRLLSRLIKESETLCLCCERIKEDLVLPKGFRTGATKVDPRQVFSDLIVCHFHLRELDMQAEFGSLREQRGLAKQLAEPSMISNWLGRAHVSVIEYHMLVKDILRGHCNKPDCSLLDCPGP